MIRLGRRTLNRDNWELKSDLPPVSDWYQGELLEFIHSSLCSRLTAMQQRFASFNEPLRVMPDSLRALPVPLADLELSSAIEQLVAARTAFVSWIDEVDRELVAFDEEATATASRMRIISAARLARRRHLGID